MIKIEDVIHGLECCKEPGADVCAECPYFDANFLDCDNNLFSDAIKFLKIQREIIEKYNKTDSFLTAHGWDWSKVEDIEEEKDN